MRSWALTISIFALAILSAINSASAQEMISVPVQLGAKQVIVYCQDIEPGSLTRRGAFKSLSAEIKTLKAKVKKDARLKPKLKQKKQLLKLGKTACQEARMVAPTPQPTPGATPPAGSTPTPTPTLDPKAVFDRSGNMTAVGKAYLGVPLDLAANIDRGDAVQRFYCVGCHAERSQWRYPELSTRIAGDPMYFQIPEELTFQQVADLVAYLNRFRLKVP